MIPGQEETDAKTTPGNNRVKALMEGKSAGYAEAGTSQLQPEQQVKAIEARFGQGMYIPC